MARKERKKKEFSKALLIQESVLIWIMTLAFLGLAALCIIHDYTGSLPWLTAMITLPWSAYGVSQCFYYNKAKAENTKDGIKYEAVLTELMNSYNVDNVNEGNEDTAEETELPNTDYGI